MGSMSDIYIGLCEIKADKRALINQLDCAGDQLAALLNGRDSLIHDIGGRWDQAQYLLDDLQQDLADISEKIRALRVNIEM